LQYVDFCFYRWQANVHACVLFGYRAAARKEALGYCVSGPSAACRIVNINNKPAE
jgi:hypothetical protein